MKIYFQKIPAELSFKHYDKQDKKFYRFEHSNEPVEVPDHVGDFLIKDRPVLFGKKIENIYKARGVAVPGSVKGVARKRTVAKSELDRLGIEKASKVIKEYPLDELKELIKGTKTKGILEAYAERLRREEAITKEAEIAAEEAAAKEAEERAAIEAGEQAAIEAEEQRLAEEEEARLAQEEADKQAAEDAELTEGGDE
jgi:hypothetical protein